MTWVQFHTHLTSLIKLIFKTAAIFAMFAGTPTFSFLTSVISFSVHLSFAGTSTSSSSWAASPRRGSWPLSPSGARAPASTRSQSCFFPLLIGFLFCLPLFLLPWPPSFCSICTWMRRSLSCWMWSRLRGKPHRGWITSTPRISSTGIAHLKINHFWPVGKYNLLQGPQVQ